MATTYRDHLGRSETPAPPPGILVADYYELTDSYSTYRPGGTKDWLIMYTVSGEGVVMSDDQPLSSRAGDITIIQPHTPHIYYTAPGCGWRKIWCHFLPKASWTDWLISLRQNQPLIHLHFEDGFAKEHVDSAFRRLVKFNRAVINPYWEELAANALEEILLMIMAHVGDDHRKLDGRVREVMNYLTHHYAEDCRIDDLARMSCLSPSRLSHLFKEQVGETIVDVLIKLRLKQAEKLLKFTSRQITEIAYDVGFHSQDYFTRKFKDFYSVNPSRYRQQFHKPDKP